MHVYQVGEFLQKLFGLLQERNYTTTRARSQTSNASVGRPIKGKDNGLFLTFFAEILSHGSAKKPFIRDKAVSSHGRCRWYMLLLAVTDENIIHRVVHSLQQTWPGCIAGKSVSFVLVTSKMERAVAFAFEMPTPIYVQRVISVVEMGAIACTMLPQRMSVVLDHFIQSNLSISADEQTHVHLREACHQAKQQEVFAVVARMTSYLEFFPEKEISVPVAEFVTGDAS